MIFADILRILSLPLSLGPNSLQICKGKKQLGEKHENFVGFKIWISWIREGVERKQPTKRCPEKALAELLLKEPHRGWQCPYCPRECFHLFGCICLRLCLVLMSSLGLWFLSFFLFLHFLNIINWRLCFVSIGLERKKVMLCPHLHIRKALHFSFF